MLQQAQDLLEEGQELKALLETLTANEWQAPTPFKDWTVNKVVQHLHGADVMAVLSLSDPEKFKATISDMRAVNKTMNPIIEGQELFERWWSYFTEMSEQLGASARARHLRFEETTPQQHRSHQEHRRDRCAHLRLDLCQPKNGTTW